MDVQNNTEKGAGVLVHAHVRMAAVSTNRIALAPVAPEELRSIASQKCRS